MLTFFCMNQKCKNAVKRINRYTGKKEYFCRLKHVNQDDYCYKVSAKFFVFNFNKGR